MRSERSESGVPLLGRISGISTVTFDVGGTLIDPFPSVGHVYAAVAAECGLPAVPAEVINARFAEAWRTKPQFDYSRAAWAKLVVAAFAGLDETHGAESELFHKVFRRFEDPSAWRVYPDVRPSLSQLRADGFKLGIISNWDDRLRPLLGRLDLAPFFAHIEVSVESGFHKPAREIFERAVARLEAVPGAVLHVGDSPREDVQGARGAGLRAVLLDRRGRSLGPETLSTLEDLRGRLA